MLGYRLDVERPYCFGIKHIVVERIEIRVLTGLDCLLLVYLDSIIVHKYTGVVQICTGRVDYEVATARSSIK